MDQLIPLVNKLQDVFNTIGSDELELPQIVVVGSQSSGKSSVLENIVGRDFLPRGSGIVTRRPLILQLIFVPSEVDERHQDFQEWGEFLHLPDQLFTDFEDICLEIEAETERLTGSGKVISSTPINLKIYSPNVLNLTLVDLPGITKVPVGDQPPDIEKQVRSLIRAYIDNPNSIILAVSPANSDLANSDALKLARLVDPDGERTIGVCTKIDLMDQGTDAGDILQGRVVPVKLGFIGVVNRSQQDINDGKSIADAIKSEREFFDNHRSYRHLRGRCGTAYLAKTMNKILMHHIRDCIPTLKGKVNDLLMRTQQKLSMLGEPMSVPEDKGAMLLQIITRFSMAYSSAIEGNSAEIATTELFGGARICYIFHDIFGRTLEAVDPLEGLTLNDIRTAIRNATGTRQALFVPEISFELLVKRQIRRLEDPSLRCAELVYEELIRIVHQIETQELARFSNLRERIVDTVTSMLKKRLSPAMAMIENLIQIELAYVNTSHPDFQSGSSALGQLLENKLKERQGNANSFTGNNVKQPGNGNNNDGSSTGASSVGRSSLDAGHAASTNSMNSFGIEENTTGSTTYESERSGGLLSMIFGGRRVVAAPISPAAVVSEKPGTPVKMPAPPNNMYTEEREALSSKERMETELIKSLICSYFTIVRKTIQDTVPKSVMLFLVNWVRENLHSHLVSQVYTPAHFDSLLLESPETAEQRREAQSLKLALQKSIDLLSEVREAQL